MEALINQKPCVVQKVETPQGFSVSYKNHFLYSKYNPSKNIITAVENLKLLPGTVILCFSPLLCYGLSELLQKLPENCLLFLCEADSALYDFSLKESDISNFCKNTSEKVFNCPPKNLYELPLHLYELSKSGIYKRVIRLDMSGGVQFNSDFYNKLFSACTDSVMTFWKNRITLTRFGRRYSRNLFENLHYLADSKPITDFFNTIEKPIIVFGAGESTQKFIDNGLLRSCTPRNDEVPFYILCADTALQPLLKNGIKPDGVFVEEAQSVIVKAFTGTASDIRIFAGLSSIPNLVHIAGVNRLSYFYTEYADGNFFDSLKSQSFMPPANKPFGSVGLTAVYYALKFRKTENIPVYVTGLDFSYSTGLTHTKGALAHIFHLIQSNRLVPPQNYSAAFGPGSEKFIGKNGRTIITTPTLKNYANMFNSFFGEEKNLFDIGESGIKLSIPHIDCFVTNESACLPSLQAKLSSLPRSDENTAEQLDYKADSNRHCETSANRHCEAEGRGNPYQNDIAAYLQNERESLEYLRNLLTGKTDLKEEKLLAEIKKIAEPREYLYLHFPDGYSFAENQSFLNRIRTEIDFFLKIL